VKVSFEEIADLTDANAAPAPARGAVPPPPPPSEDFAPPPPPPNGMSPPPPPPAQAPPGPAPAARGPLPPLPPPAGPCRAGESLAQLQADDDIAGPLCVDRTEVTVAQYTACVNANACHTENLACDSGANWGRPDHLNHPMNCVSTEQSEAYCAWKQARLPTMNEWRAFATPHDGEFPWGGDNAEGHACWSGEEKRTGTCPVGFYARGIGPWGLYDLAGNVAEWTSTDRRGKRMFLGGAWDDKKAKKLRTDAENKNDPSSHFDDVGFRCVRSVR
jgi:hypothetical protein